MTPSFSKCTSILIVNDVEPCIDFWVKRLGFEKSAEVLHEGRIGFAILTSGSVEIMYQSIASVQADLPESTLTKSALYLDVSDIDATIARLEGVDVIVPKRDTFYGATEFWVREPGGSLIGFAQLAESSH